MSSLRQVGIDVTTHVVNNLIGDPAKGYLGIRMEGAHRGTPMATDGQ